MHQVRERHREPDRLASLLAPGEREHPELWLSKIRAANGLFGLSIAWLGLTWGRRKDLRQQGVEWSVSAVALRRLFFARLTPARFRSPAIRRAGPQVEVDQCRILAEHRPEAEAPHNRRVTARLALPF